MLVLSSCGEKREGFTEPAKRELAGVVTEEVFPGPLEEFDEVPGTVRSRTSTVVAAKAAGEVLRVNFKEGDSVRLGQLLAVIDGRSADAQMAVAKAGEAEADQALAEVDHAIRAAEAALQAATTGRDLAAATLERYRALRDKRSVTPQEFDEVQAKSATAAAEANRAASTLESLKSKRAQVLARIDQARAHRATAALHQEYTQVLAPASGIVTAKRIEPGMIAAQGMPLLTIEDSANYQLELAVEESRLPGIRVGTEVRARIDALGSEFLSLRVNEILPATEPLTRTGTVRLNLPSRPGLRSGLFGRALIPVGKREAITIPAALVVNRGGLHGVWVVEGHTVRYRLIMVGKTLDDRVEVLSGLSAGDRLITSPRANLADGAQVAQ
jgi:multidrug efflux pump subunit AcrA (membrane-fusion protein)